MFPERGQWECPAEVRLKKLVFDSVQFGRYLSTCRGNLIPPYSGNNSFLPCRWKQSAPPKCIKNTTASYGLRIRDQLRLSTITFKLQGSLKEVTSPHFECTACEEICVNIRVYMVYALHNPRKTHHSNDGIEAYFEIGQDHFILLLSLYSLLHNWSFWRIKWGCQLQISYSAQEESDIKLKIQNYTKWTSIAYFKRLE